MNFLGVGLPEMLVIFAVALLVFGPRKLPEISRVLAKTLRSLQDASKEFEAQLNREAQELEKATRTAAVAAPKAAKTAAEAQPKTDSAPKPVPETELTSELAAAVSPDGSQAADAA